MAGIYLHIPFCKQACHYCDFHFSTSIKLKDDLVAALQKEIFLQKDYSDSKEPLQSIYFGGGTPSLLPVNDVERLLDEIRKYFSITNDAEVTLEANPDDLTKEKLTSLRKAGINRLSIGVQSFFDEDLKWMNRAHNKEQAVQSIKDAEEAGFDNITIDLIYGTPVLSTERWEHNLQTAFEMDVQHLSCYSLTVETRTALAHQIATKQVASIDEQKAAEQFLLLMDMTEASGFEQYEISNFARDGRYAVHNSNYWKGEKYLGIGPSSHSYNGVSRQWNIRNNSVYIKTINEGKIPSEREELSEANHFNEYIMTSLRTMWGCDLEKMKGSFGKKRTDKFVSEATVYLNQGLMEQQKEKLILTKKGRLFADKIASELFV